MAEDAVPILWLCGPTGVGKSTVSWQLFTELALAGVQVAFADTDQLGMCCPGPPGDDLVQEIRDETVRMDRSGFADACVDTTGVPASHVVGLVRTACARWPGFGLTMTEPAGPSALAARGDAAAASADGQVMAICGPPGVGKSTIGFQFYLACLNAGLAAGYVDLDQIGMVRPAAGDRESRHRLKARNLAAIWQRPQPWTRTPRRGDD